MVFSIFLGAFLTAVTIAIHAIGTSFWVQQLRTRKGRLVHESGVFRGVTVLCATALVLFLLHTIEVLVWATAFLLIPDLEHIRTIEEAVYFSMVTFGSLGYGDIVIDNRYRLLSGIECMTGLLIFGWSTALVMSVVQHLWRTIDGRETFPEDLEKDADNRTGA